MSRWCSGRIRILRVSIQRWWADKDFESQYSVMKNTYWKCPSCFHPPCRLSPATGHVVWYKQSYYYKDFSRIMHRPLLLPLLKLQNMFRLLHFSFSYSLVITWIMKDSNLVTPLLMEAPRENRCSSWQYWCWCILLLNDSIKFGSDCPSYWWS